jgi:cell division protein FtsL
MSLQDAFYVIGIIFMSLMLIIIVALVTAVFVIKAKITHIHRQIEEKLSNVSSLGEKISRTAKKVLNK